MSTDVIDYAVPAVHTCAVYTDGRVSCWGSWDDVWGVEVVPAGTFTQIAATNYTICGLRTDRTVECWGKNEMGEGSPP